MLFTALILAFAAQDLQDPGDLDALLSASSQESAASILALADEYLLPTDTGWEKQLVDRLPEADARQKLLLGRILAQHDSLAAGEPLLTLLEEGDPELVRGALSTLGLPTFTYDETVQQALGDWLTSHQAGDQLELYTEVAVTLFAVGDGTRRRAARQMMRNLLLSEDTRERRAAALALGRVGDLDDPTTLDELELLSLGIGPDAVLAKSLLERYEQSKRFKEKQEVYDRLLSSRDPKGGASDPGDLTILDEILQHIEFRHMEGDKFTREELVGAAADGLLGRLDPHSNYMSGEEYKEFVFDMKPEYGGIGAYVNTINGVFTISRPIYSGPAYEVGLLSGDQVLEVDGWSTIDQPMDETISRLKGKPGTNVEVKVFRRGWTEPREFSISRRRIELPTLAYEDLPGGILYLDLVNFSDDCGAQIRSAIRDAESRSTLNGVVLDLRDNPGGYLSEAVQVADVFLPPGKLVVSTRSRTEAPEKFYTMESAAVDESIPVMVLINKYSASASEIVAGALSIHHRAKAVGMRTHGKGSVQNLIPLRSLRDEPWVDENRNSRFDPWEEYRDRNSNGEHDFGPRIKLTMAYYYLPDGSTIHTRRDHEGRVVEKGGVQPDIEVDFPELDIASLRELDRLVGESAFRNYAEDLYAQNPEVAVDLAEYDARDVTRYPGWDEFYAQLGTTLDDDEVRRWVRRRLRAVVSDARGKVFAGSGFFGDFLEDPQLAVAIQQILQDAGLTVAEVPEYASVF